LNENASPERASNGTSEARPGRLSAVILTAQVSERFFTLVLTVLIARSLGASKGLDIALLALAVPNALGDLLETIFYVSLLPLFSRKRTEEGDQAGWRLANSSFNAVGLGVVGLFAIYVGLLPFLVDLMAQGYSPEELRETIRYGWIAAPIILLRGAGGMLASFLMSRDRVWPAFGRLIARGVARVALFVLLHSLGWGVMAFVAATTLSDLAAVLFCAPALRRVPGVTRYRLRAMLPASALLQVFASIGSQAIIGGVNASVLIFERSFASGLAPGSVATLNYTRGLALLPLMAGRSISAGLYPRFAREAALDAKRLALTVWVGLRAVLFVTVPLAVIFLVARQQLVTAFYQRGAFTAKDVLQVSSLMPYYLVACVVWSLSFLVSRALFALMRSALVAKLELVSWVVYIAAAAYLTPRLGLVALPVAFLLRVTISTLLLLGAAALSGVIRATRPFRYVMLTSLGAVLLAAGAWAGRTAAARLLPGGGTGSAVAAGVAAFLGGAIVFLPYASLYARAEIGHLFEFLRRRA
jgi:putative peptidoglycan lipid II flippase